LWGGDLPFYPPPFIRDARCSTFTNKLWFFCVEIISLSIVSCAHLSNFWQISDNYFTCGRTVTVIYVPISGCDKTFAPRCIKKVKRSVHRWWWKQSDIGLCWYKNLRPSNIILIQVAIAAKVWLIVEQTYCWQNKKASSWMLTAGGL
jgi:hypothetical protein